MTIDELKYLRNLIATSGDMGCKWRIGDMKEFVDCSELYKKIEGEINVHHHS